MAAVLQTMLAKQDICAAHVGMDEWMAQLPQDWVNIDASNPKRVHSDGFVIERDDSGRVVAISLGKVVANFRKALFSSLKQIQCSWILDGCLLPDELAAAKEVLSGEGCVWINLKCDVNMLAQREEARGGFQGLAAVIQPQLDAIESSKYDFEIETTNMNPNEVAQAIIQKIPALAAGGN